MKSATRIEAAAAGSGPEPSFSTAVTPVAAGGELETPVFRRLPQNGLLRMVEFRNESGRWLFAANFGEEAAAPQLPAGAALLAGSLRPGCAALWQL